MELLFQFVVLDSIYIPTGRIEVYVVLLYIDVDGEMKRADRLSTSLNIFSFHVDRTRTK